MMWNAKQIQCLKFTAVRSLVGDEGEFEWNGAGVLTFLEGTTPVTEEQITTEMARIQAEYDAQEYARNRKAEYDALNQFEMQYDDKLNGTTTWDDAIEAIKAKYPKP